MKGLIYLNKQPEAGQLIQREHREEAGLGRGSPCLPCLQTGNRELRRAHGLNTDQGNYCSKIFKKGVYLAFLFLRER